MPRYGKSENEPGSIFLSDQRFILAWTVMMELIFSHCSLVYSFTFCNLVFHSFLIFLFFFPSLFFLFSHHHFLFQSCHLSLHSSPLFSILLSFFCTPWNLAEPFSFPVFSVSPLPVRLCLLSAQGENNSTVHVLLKRSEKLHTFLHKNLSHGI